MRMYILGEDGEWHKLMPISVSFEPGKKKYLDANFLENWIVKKTQSPFQVGSPKGNTTPKGKKSKKLPVRNEKYIYEIKKRFPDVLHQKSLHKIGYKSKRACHIMAFYYFGITDCRPCDKKAEMKIQMKKTFTSFTRFTKLK